MTQSTGSARWALVLEGDDPQALTAVRSLARAGWRVVVPSGSRAAASRHVCATEHLPSAREDALAFAAGIGDLARSGRVDVLVPCDDLSVETWYAYGDAGGLPVAAAARGCATSFADKAATLRLAEAAGFAVPPWHAPATVDEALDAIRDIGVPCVLKHSHSYERIGSGARHRRHVVVQTLEEARRALDAETSGELPLIQAYVGGRPMAVAAVIADGSFAARVARETFSYFPIRGGNSVWLRTVGPHEPGVREAFDLLLDIGFDGVGDVQYIVGTDGVPRLMEISVRLNAWTDLAIAAGVDLPAIAVACAVGEPAGACNGWRVGVERRAPVFEARRVWEALRQPNDLPPGVSRSTVARALWPPWRPGMHYRNLDPTDVGPLLPGFARKRLERH